MKNLSPEETEAQREQEQKMLDFYNEKLPFLRVKEEFDSLQTSIAENLIRKIQADEAYMGYIIKKREMQDAHAAEISKENSDVSNKDK